MPPENSKAIPRQKKPQKESRPDIWGVIMGLKRPVQYAGLFLVVVTFYWLREFHDTTKRNLFIVLVLTAIIGVAVIFLFSLREVEEKKRPFLILFIYGCVLAFLIYLITLFKDPKGLTARSVFLYVRDIGGKNIPDFKDIDIIRVYGTSSDEGTRNNSQGFFEFQLTDTAVHQLQFKITTKGIQFANNTDTWTTDSRKDNDTVVIIRKPVTVSPAAKPDVRKGPVHPTGPVTRDQPGLKPLQPTKNDVIVTITTDQDDAVLVDGAAAEVVSNTKNEKKIKLTAGRKYMLKIGAHQAFSYTAAADDNINPYDHD